MVRSPLRVAVITFGAVVLIGTIISFAILGIHSDQTQRVGQGIGILGAICATIAYYQQKRRMDSK